MRIRLRLFGATVASFTYDPTEYFELEEDEPTEVDTREIGGGSAHNFERSVEWDYYPEPDEDRLSGFGFSCR